MVAIVTLHVNACSGGSALSGAAVTDGYNTVYTNAYGEIAVYWDDTVYAGYSVAISKSGYQTRQINIYNSQNGTTVTTCLDAVSGGGGPGPGPGPGPSCFIVTAATGSDLSDEVTALRALRDAVMERSPAAGRLIDAVYAQYWQFSPALAERIAGNGVLKEGALMVAVRPLLAWYRLAGALALGGDVVGARVEFEEACPLWMQPDSIADLVGRIRRERVVPAEAPAMLHDLAAHLAHAASLPLVDWAILDPLETAWATGARQTDPVAAVANWLAQAPTGPMAVADKSEAMQVTALVGFDAAAQIRLQERIGAAGRGCGCR